MISDWGIAAAGIGGGIAAIILARLLICCFGFTCCGVKKNSYASRVHSGIGDVEGGSCFSICQSIGAAGFPCIVNCTLFLFGCATTVVLIIMFAVKVTSPDVGNTTIYENYSTSLFETTSLPIEVKTVIL